jgi:uncharacterized protein (UPF0333 family)
LWEIDLWADAFDETQTTKPPKDNMRSPSYKRRKSQRKGAAVVEFAVCIPVIMVIVFGAIEAASLLFLRQALIQSAYEGVKVAVKANAENGDAVAAAEAVAAGRRIENLTIIFDPEDITSASKGEMIRVRVSAPGDSNSLVPFGPLGNRQISADAVMVKE